MNWHVNKDMKQDTFVDPNAARVINGGGDDNAALLTKIYNEQGKIYNLVNSIPDTNMLELLTTMSKTGDILQLRSKTW